MLRIINKNNTMLIDDMKEVRVNTVTSRKS